jgi:hypothetical protein
MRTGLLLVLVMPVAGNLDICSSQDDSSNGHTFARMAKDCRDYLMIDGTYDSDIDNSASLYAQNGCPFWDDRDARNLQRRCVVMKISTEGGIKKWFIPDEMNDYKLAATACELTLLEAQAVIADAPLIFGSIGFNGRPMERHRQSSAIDGNDGSMLDLPEPLVDTPDEPGVYDFGFDILAPISTIQHNAKKHALIGHASNNGTWYTIVGENGFNRAGWHTGHARVVDTMPPAMEGKLMGETTRAMNYRAVSAPYSSIHAPGETPPRLAPQHVQEKWSTEEREGITRVLQQFRCSLVKAMELGFEKSFDQITKLERIDELKIRLTSECFWDTIEDYCGNIIPMVSMSMKEDTAKLYFFELVTNFYKPEYAIKRIIALQDPLYKSLIDEQKASIKAVLDKHHENGNKPTLTPKETKARDQELAAVTSRIKRATYLPKFNGVVEDARSTGCGSVDDTVQMPDACVREHVLRTVVPPYMGFPYASTQNGSKVVPSSQVWRGIKQTVSIFNQTSHRWHENRRDNWQDNGGFPGITIDRPGTIAELPMLD